MAIQLNLIPSGVMPVAYANQYDFGRPLEFLIYSGTEAFEIPTGYSVSLRATKPDGYGIAVSGSYTAGDNAVSVTIPEQLTAVAGNAICELVFLNASSVRVGTINFILAIEPAALSDDTVISDSDIAYAEEVLDQIGSVQAIANNVAQNTAAISAEASTRAAAVTSLQAADTALQNAISAETAARTAADTDLAGQIAALQGAVGSPLVAATAAAMTDTDRIYVYTGSETGYTAGNWYYYNGSAWVSGGVYNAVAINTDTTLSVAGMAADAKATGDEVADLKSQTSKIESDIYTVSDNLFDFDSIISNQVPAGIIGSDYDAMVALNGWYTSNYIPVVAGEQYALLQYDEITQNAVLRIACYSNGALTYRSSANEPNPYTIPSGVDHVRFYSNTASLFSARTNTSFKKYSLNMNKAWTPYGYISNFLTKGTLPEYGVYVDGSNYYHFVNFGEKTLIRLFKREGPNNLFQFSALYVGEVSEYGVSIKETIATNGTDTVGPISILRQGIDSVGMWAGGWHTRTVSGTVCPTAKQQSLDIRINGKSIANVNGLHYGECVVTAVNQIFFPQTITDASLSTATQAIEETVWYVLNEKMTARVRHKYLENTRVSLYYGMQAIRTGFDRVLLPNNESEIVFADMTEDVKLDRPERLMAVANDDWNYDLILKDIGLADYVHNPGSGANKFGSLPKVARKIYWVLIEGTYDYSHITSGKILSWEGEWNIYPN